MSWTQKHDSELGAYDVCTRCRVFAVTPEEKAAHCCPPPKPLSGVEMVLAALLGLVCGACLLYGLSRIHPLPPQRVEVER